MGFSTDSSPQSLDFPLTVTNSIAENEKEIETCTHKDTKSGMLERLRSVRLICHDLETIKLDIQRLQVK
jgi:hypothetical protein